MAGECYYEERTWVKVKHHRVRLISVLTKGNECGQNYRGTTFSLSTLFYGPVELLYHLS